jgi:hypothetical protein
VDIIAGNLVWVEGPYPAGTPDITIFRNCLSHHLDPFERVEANDGYVGEAPRQVKCPTCAANPTENLGMQSRVRSRHETLNGRFKCWGILKQIYRHDDAKHGQVFWAIAVIIQLAINDGQKLFEVEYSD